MADTINPYAAALAQLERDVAFWKQQIADAEFLMAGLRNRLASGARSPALALQAAPPARTNGAARTAARGTLTTKPKRGVTTGMVLQAVKDHPGLTSFELVEMVSPRFTHVPSNRARRKLVSSILGHLRDKTGRIKQDEQERYFAVE